jgi:hypothetical protein
MPRRLKQRLRQKQAVRSYHQGICPRRLNAPDALTEEFLGLVNLKPSLDCGALDRAEIAMHAASCRPIRLREYEHYLVAGVDQASQRDRGKLGCAGED